MSKVAIAENIFKSNMDVYLKKAELEKIKEEVEGQKFVNSGMIVFCIVFGICILPLLVIPILYLNVKQCKLEIEEVELLLEELDNE